MRSLVVALAVLLGSGCFFPTSMLSPRTLPAGQTAVEAGITLPVPTQVEARLRRGIVTGVEAAARIGGGGVIQRGRERRTPLTLGADVTAQLVTPPEGQGGAVGLVSVGVSTLVGGLNAFESSIGRQFAYPTLVGGWESASGASIFGGVRGLVALDGPNVLVGPIVGVRVPVSSNPASRRAVAIEVAVLRGDVAGEDTLVPALQLTFGRLPGR